MSQMRVPVTDAFDDPDQLQSLEVELTPRQIEWLEQRAEERGLSLDHMLRSVITAQIRDTTEASAPPATTGDGAPQSSGREGPSPNGAAKANEEDDPPSIVESLRSASERLQDLTDEEDPAEDASDLRDTLDRLQDRIDASSDEATSPEDDSSEEVLPDDPGRSMFDMVEE